MKVILHLKPLKQDAVDRAVYEIEQLGDSQGSLFRLSDGDDYFEAEFSKVCQNGTAEVFEAIQEEVIRVMAGEHCAIVAYGQSRSGKSAMLFGDQSKPGVVQLAVEKLLTQGFAVSLSVMLIREEKLRDCLQGSARVTLEEDPVLGVKPCNCTERQVLSAADVTAALSSLGEGGSFTKVAWLRVESEQPVEEAKYSYAKMMFVELPGSETYDSHDFSRAFKRGDGDRSLTVFGRVLNSMALKSEHPAFDESQVTKLLKDSIGCRSVIIGALNPTV